MAFGKADLPLRDAAKDALGLEKFALALTKFVVGCETPMTVALQGEWGSGKTSLINMVCSLLEKDYQEQVVLHQFETWQYGAVGEDDLLGVHLITNLTQALATHKQDNGFVARSATAIGHMTRRMASAASFATKAAVAGTISNVTGSFVDGPTLVEGLTGGPQGGVGVADLGALKREFSNLVEQLVTGGKGVSAPERVVVFIDDLDRVRPGRAVAMLEILKNFLDVDHCVFVVACDYQVVHEGVRERLGITDPEKVNAFFHKIFQLPFVMPTYAYRVSGLLKEYLESRVQPGRGGNRANVAEALAAKTASLIEMASGTNPRAFKRFLNTLDLLSCVSEAETEPGADNKMWADEDSNIALIGLTAMQAAWPEVTRYLSECDTEQLTRALAELRDGFASDQGGNSEVAARLAEIYGASWREEPRVDKLCSFTADLFKLFDADDSGTLDEREVEQLQHWARKLSLTGIAIERTAGSGQSAFREEVKRCAKDERRPFDAGALLAMVDALGARVGDSRRITRYWDARSTAFIAKTDSWSGRVLTVLPDARLKLNVGRDSGSPFDVIGQALLTRCLSLGLEWQQRGQHSSGLDLVGPSWTAATQQQLCEALGDMLTDIEQAAQASGPVSTPQPEPAAE